LLSIAETQPQYSRLVFQQLGFAFAKKIFSEKTLNLLFSFNKKNEYLEVFKSFVIRKE